MRHRSALLRSLNGLLCLYKPPEMAISSVENRLKLRLSADLNALPVPVQPLETKVSHPPPNTSSELTVTTSPSLLIQNPLLQGPRFRPADIYLHFASPLCPFASGVQVVGIGRRGVRLAQLLERAQHIRVYRLTVQLGRSTLDGTADSLTALRTSWRHVSHTKVDRLCSILQGQHQQRMFELAGVTPHSHEAFLLASRGLVRPLPPARPAASEEPPPPAPPLIYGLRCVEFEPPQLVLEVHCVNETAEYLLQLVDSLGTRLKSSASCSSIRRLRHGHFVVGRESLLVKEWTLARVQENLEQCGQILPPSSLRFNQLNFESREPKAIPAFEKSKKLLSDS